MPSIGQPTWAQVVSRGLPCSDLSQSGPTTSAAHKVLHHPGIRGLIAQYMTVVELVRVRRVSSQWRQLFSEPCCWAATRFEANNEQLFHTRLRLDCMPWLQELTLRYSEIDPVCDWDSGHSFVQPFHQQLDTGSRTLRKLRIQGIVNRTLLRALPQLTELFVEGDIDPGAFASLSTQLTSLDVVPVLRDDHITALAARPRLQLQHCGTVNAALPCVQSLVHACPNLTSLQLVHRTKEYGATALVAALESLLHLSRLRIDNAPCSVELVHAVQRLSRLQQLVLSGYSGCDAMTPTQDFWRAIPSLHALLSSHVTGEHQHAKLRIEGCEGNAECSSEWWTQALLASHHCTELSTNFDQAPEAAWQMYLSHRQQKSSSAVRIMRDFSVSCGPDRLANYLKAHVGLTDLFVCTGRVISDAQLAAAVANLPDLTQLTVYNASLVTLHTSLNTSGCLPKLQHLSLHHDDVETLHLADTLSIVQKAPNLQYLHLTAPSNVWGAVSLAELKACTNHIGMLNVDVTEPVRDTAWSKRHRTGVVKKLLLLPALDYLGVQLYTQSLTISQMAAWRRRNGLNSLQVHDNGHYARDDY